jgi:hypothetical protein
MRSDRGITGVTFFMSDEHLVGDDAGDQEVAMFLCAAEKIEVADMKEIKGPWRMTDADHGNDLLIAAFVTVDNYQACERAALRFLLSNPTANNLRNRQLHLCKMRSGVPVRGAWAT